MKQLKDTVAHPLISPSTDIAIQFSNINEGGSLWRSWGLKLNHVNHVVTIVKDTKRSLQFYCDFLGIKQIQSQVDNPDISWLKLPSGVMLHLIKTDDAPAHPPNIHHAFEVEDFDAAKTTVEEEGMDIESSGVRHDGQRYFFIRDPDGSRVELCTPSGF